MCESHSACSRGHRQHRVAPIQHCQTRSWHTARPEWIEPSSSHCIRSSVPRVCLVCFLVAPAASRTYTITRAPEVRRHRLGGGGRTLIVATAPVDLRAFAWPPLVTGLHIRTVGHLGIAWLALIEHQHIVVPPYVCIAREAREYPCAFHVAWLAVATGETARKRETSRPQMRMGRKSPDRTRENKCNKPERGRASWHEGQQYVHI